VGFLVGRKIPVNGFCELPSEALIRLKAFLRQEERDQQQREEQIELLGANGLVCTQKVAAAEQGEPEKRERSDGTCLVGLSWEEPAARIPGRSRGITPQSGIAAHVARSKACCRGLITDTSQRDETHPVEKQLRMPCPTLPVQPRDCPHMARQSGSLFLSLYDSFIHYFTPVYPDAIHARVRRDSASPWRLAICDAAAGENFAGLFSRNCLGYA
jgi:hypothetical protein